MYEVKEYGGRTLYRMKKFCPPENAFGSVKAEPFFRRKRALPSV